MADLTSELQELIVERLACFTRPVEIKKELEKEHGIEITLQALGHYDPTTAQGEKKLSKKLKTLFEKVRDAYLKAESSVGVMHRRVRMEILQRLIDEQLDAKVKNPRLIAELVKQSAMEAGGAFTNKREISGPDGKPIEVSTSARDAASKELDAWRKEQAEGLGALLAEPPQE